MGKTLTVVIPAYNEEQCIEAVIRTWVASLKEVDLGGPFEVLVVNDGSKDRTREILDRLKGEVPQLRVIHKPNGGHGSAVLCGYEAATTSDWVFQVDSDDQFEAEDFRILWNARHRSRFLLGHRRERQDGRGRLWISALNRRLVGWLFGVRGKDFNIPFRLMRGEYLESLLQGMPEGVFAPNIFLAILASALGEDLQYLPVTHKPRKTGHNSILGWGLLKCCFRVVRELVEFRREFSGSLYMIKDAQFQQPAPRRLRVVGGR